MTLAIESPLGGRCRSVWQMVKACGKGERLGIDVIIQSTLRDIKVQAEEQNTTIWCGGKETQDRSFLWLLCLRF